MRIQWTLPGMLLLLSAVALALPARAGDVLRRTDLLQALSGGDETARVHARQMLPREGVAVAPGVLKALADPRPEVWWAAYAVLSDLCAESGAPGRNSDQFYMANQVLTLLAPETSPHLKLQGLRLLPIVLPEGLDVAPMAALLDDPDFRERTRAALQEAGTTQAREALRAALAKHGDDPNFTAALLSALATLHDAPTLELALGKTGDADAGVRAAAARALAWAGRLDDVPAVLAVYHAADEATHDDAANSVLLLADAIARNGGNWQTAMRLYRILLGDADDMHRAAALVGLAKYGDETVTQDILRQVNAENGPSLYGPAIAALENVQGRAGSHALLTIYPELPAPMQPLLIGVFGRRRDPIFVPALQTAAASTDATLRHAAFEALAATGSPESVDALATALTNAPGEERDFLRGLLRRLADDYRARGDAAAAGKAFLAVYRYAADDAERAYALEGVKEFPSAEAYDVLLDTTTPAERAALPIPVLAGIAKALQAAQRTQDAAAFVDLLWGRAADGEAIRSLQELDNAAGGAFGVQAKLGYLGPWRLAGPFPWSKEKSFASPAIPVDHVEVDATFAGKSGEIHWSDPVGPGMVELTGPYGMLTDASVFAATTVVVPSETKAELRLGSDDGIRAWVNGEPVHENNIDRGAALDQDIVPIHLRAGENLIVVEVTQNGGGWNFIGRLSAEGGGPLSFTTKP